MRMWMLRKLCTSALMPTRESGRWRREVLRNAASQCMSMLLLQPVVSSEEDGTERKRMEEEEVVHRRKSPQNHYLGVCLRIDFRTSHSALPLPLDGHLRSLQLWNLPCVLVHSM